MSYRLGAVWPKKRCCSTDAGSVSPWVTMIPAQHVSVLTGDLLPGGVVPVVAETDLAIGLRIREEDAPAIVGHAYVVEVCPSVSLHTHRGPKEDVLFLKPFRTHLFPPVEIVRKPPLERSPELSVVGQAHVVGNLVVRYGGHVAVLSLGWLRFGWGRTRDCFAFHTG